MLAIWASAALAPVAAAQISPELPVVRQLVTFRFAPGRMAEALQIYRDQLRPIYAGISPLLRFRGYSEIESPEPLDLVVVSSYRAWPGWISRMRPFDGPGPCTVPCRK